MTDLQEGAVVFTTDTDFRIYRRKVKGAFFPARVFGGDRRGEETLFEDEDDDEGRGRFGCGFAALWIISSCDP